MSQGSTDTVKVTDTVIDTQSRTQTHSHGHRHTVTDKDTDTAGSQLLSKTFDIF